MPLMNGLEETRILKKLMPAVAVIIYSAHSGAIVLKEALDAGASAVVSKSEPLAVLIGKAPGTAGCYSCAIFFHAEIRQIPMHSAPKLKAFCSHSLATGRENFVQDADHG
jgi:DNA-binding NarL/FixJ family response regulator